MLKAAQKWAALDRYHQSPSIEAAPMALQKDKPPRPDLSREDVRQIVQINALGLEITVRAPRESPRRKTTINALGLEPMRRNVQRPSRGAAPVRQRPSTEEIVAEFEDMKVSDVATKERAELQSVAAASSDHDESLEEKFEKKTLVDELNAANVDEELEVPAGMDWLQNKKARVDEPNDAGDSPSKRGPLAPPPGESPSKKAHAEPPEESDDESDLNLEDADPVPLLWRAMADGMDDPEVRAAYER